MAFGGLGGRGGGGVDGRYHRISIGAHLIYDHHHYRFPLLHDIAGSIGSWCCIVVVVVAAACVLW